MSGMITNTGSAVAARPVSAFAALILACASPPASGQEVVEQARGCAEIADDAERLACYDRALTAAPRADAPAREPPARHDPDAARRDVLPARAGRAPSIGEVERPPAAPAAAQPAPRDAPVPAIERTLAGPRIGEESAPRTVTVTEIRRRPASAVFVIEGGEVWTQTDARRLFVPPVPFQAEIRPGALGSYFLVPSEGGRAVRVRRR